MRIDKSKINGHRLLFALMVVLTGGSSLLAQPPQAQPELPPPYVPPGGPVPVIPASPPGERVVTAGQPPVGPAPTDIVVVPPPATTPILFVPGRGFRTYDPNEPYRIWARADLLLWWVKNAPLPASVVVTSDINTDPG